MAGVSGPLLTPPNPLAPPPTTDNPLIAAGGVCRSLPYEALLAQLSQAVGAQVNQGNLRHTLTQAFGEDASLKAQAYMGVSLTPCFMSTKSVPSRGVQRC